MVVAVAHGARVGRDSGILVLTVNSFTQESKDSTTLDDRTVCVDFKAGDGYRVKLEVSCPGCAVGPEHVSTSFAFTSLALTSSPFEFNSHFNLF